MYKISKVIKRFIAISFTILANILLLAHAIVPHHYHESEVCTEISHCEENSSTDKQKSEHNHEHNAEFCIVSQTFVVRTNQLEQEFLSFECNNRQWQIIVLLKNDITEKLSSHHFKISKNKTPYISTNYSYVFSKSIGLRAPPIV